MRPISFLHNFCDWVPSISTKSVSPLGNGPKKSMQTVSKFSLGISRIYRGCGAFGRAVAWHGMQASISGLTSESIKGNQIFDVQNFWYLAFAISFVVSCVQPVVKLDHFVLYF